MLATASRLTDTYQSEKDLDLVIQDDGIKDLPSEMLFKAGQSKRIWNELYKVSDEFKNLFFLNILVTFHHCYR